MDDTSPQTVPDLGLLEGALIHIKEHPEEWNQGYWGRTTACGTTFCLAGHVAILAGAEAPKNISTLDFWRVRPDGSFYSCCPESGSSLNTLHVSDYATQALGLTKGQTTALFNHTRTLEQLDILVARLKADPEDNLSAYAFEQGWDI